MYNTLSFTHIYNKTFAVTEEEKMLSTHEKVT